MSQYYETEEQEQVNKQPIDLLGLFFKYLSHWKIFLVSLAVCLILAVLYLKTRIPVYSVKTTVLLKDDKKGGGIDALSALKDLGMFDVKNNVDNELEVLKTSNLTEQVVRELGIYATYTEKGNFKNRIIYGADCPIRVILEDASLDTLKTSIEFEATVPTHDGVTFSGTFKDKAFNVKTHSTDSVVVLPFGKVFFRRTVSTGQSTMTIGISIQKPVRIANGMLGGMTMELTSKTTSVVNIALTISNIDKGKDFLYKLIEVYNREDMKDQNIIASSTDKFIGNRLDSLSKELRNAELGIEDYKQKQGLTDIKSEADLFIEKTGAYEQKRLDVETQLAIVTYVDDYMHKRENRYHLLPAGTGIQSENLNGLIADYNKLLLERERYARIANGTNQSVIDLTAKIDGMFTTVQLSIRDEKRNLQIARQDLINKELENSGRIKEVPRQEREYAEIKRQQSIKEALYVFLLQKKEENSLNMLVVVPMAKIIDTPSGDDNPVSPKKPMILLMGFILGLIIPIIGLFIRELLRFHVENKEELEKISIVPILGEILKNEQTSNIIVRENSTDRITEMFRMLRTNMMFVLTESSQKVINVVSSIEGEGKTFICINLAMSLAMLDKKVLLIGLDVRRPTLTEYLGLDHQTGITMYLSEQGHLTQNELVRPSGIHPNLSIISSGPVAPNPSELMAKPLLDKLIADCKEKFDYIILDTPPIGIVSDAYLLNRFADLNLYLVRADYTPKVIIEEATNIFKQNKLTQMYFVLNAIDSRKTSFKYKYGRKYRYVYGENKK
jgi:tyrosine-protein kinase Etk/Wzc